MTTRATILSRAFARIGIADYEFDVSPDERAHARQTLDAMMAEWAASGLQTGYTPSTGADNDGAAMTTLPYLDAPIWNNLAVRIAPDYGKASLPGLARDAKRGYDLVASRSIDIPVERRPRPRVIGYYRRYGR